MDEIISHANKNQFLDHNSEFSKTIIMDLERSKILLNPIKLTIIKILSVYSSYPSFKVREMLKISWGRFSANVSSLIKKGYITMSVEFFRDSPTQVLQIENLGCMKYLELREIMKSIFDL